MKDIIEKLLSIPKSFYVCMRLLPFREALKLPLLIRYNVKCLSLRGSVKVTDIQPAGVKIGFGHVGAFDKSYERTILQINGNILFNNNGGVFPSDTVHVLLLPRMRY